MRAISLLALLSCSSPTVAPSICAADPRVETFQMGDVSKGAAGTSVTLVTANPPAIQQGLNDWVVSITDAQGNPVSGTVTESALMPDHGHGSPTPSTVTPEGNGKYDISGINLSMRGVWTITIDIATPTSSDSATFTFCVDGTTS